MIYIMAYRLCRKNARRKVYVRLQCKDQYEAVKQFEFYVKNRPSDDKPKDWELLTGDWKHICFFCKKCDRITDNTCTPKGFSVCPEYLRMKGNEENGKS